VIIRAATLSDAEAIGQIQNPIIRDTSITFNSRERTVDEIQEAIRGLPCFLVAETRGRLGGFLSYDQFRKGPGYARCMEHTIIVAAEARGQGLGLALIQAAVQHAKANGVGSLWAGVSAENPKGVTFHARNGFTEIAHLPQVGFKFGRWMDLILMRKWLGDGS
jgi:phosphinothricin acetyltransferase